MPRNSFNVSRAEIAPLPRNVANVALGNENDASVSYHRARTVVAQSGAPGVDLDTIRILSERVYHPDFSFGDHIFDSGNLRNLRESSDALSRNGALRINYHGIAYHVERVQQAYSWYLGRTGVISSSNVQVPDASGNIHGMYMRELAHLYSLIRYEHPELDLRSSRRPTIAPESQARQWERSLRDSLRARPSRSFDGYEMGNGFNSTPMANGNHLTREADFPDTFDFSTLPFHVNAVTLRSCTGCVKVYNREDT